MSNIDLEELAQEWNLVIRSRMDQYKLGENLSLIHEDPLIKALASKYMMKPSKFVNFVRSLRAKAIHQKQGPNFLMFGKRRGGDLFKAVEEEPNLYRDQEIHRLYHEGMTQANLARLFQVSRQRVNQIVSGGVDPTIHALQQFKILKETYRDLTKLQKIFDSIDEIITQEVEGGKQAGKTEIHNQEV